MTYTVKEIFKTIQGEGFHAGRVAVFCRFAGCNLWTGQEEDRADAACTFCDTDFVGGDKYKTAEALALAIADAWGPSRKHRMVVFTGGEPALQFDADLLLEMHDRGFFTAIETNGTVKLSIEPDWICVSPKAGTAIKQDYADEVKVVFPQDGLILDDIKDSFRGALCYSIQPMDGPNIEQNSAAAVAYAIEHPWWRLSVQTHKILGVR